MIFNWIQWGRLFFYLETYFHLHYQVKTDITTISLTLYQITLVSVRGRYRIWNLVLRSLRQLITSIQKGTYQRFVSRKIDQNSSLSLIIVVYYSFKLIVRELPYLNKQNISRQPKSSFSYICCIKKYFKHQQEVCDTHSFRQIH